MIRPFRTGVVALGTLFTLAACGPSGPARPFLWEVRLPDATATSYLFGTMHVPDPRVTTLHPAASTALANCDELVVEIVFDDATNAKAASAMRLDEGKELTEFVPPSVWKRLVARLDASGIPRQVVQPLQPWAAAVTLVQGEVAKVCGTELGDPLDVVLADRARAAGKTVSQLETVEEQLGAFASFDDREHTAMLKGTLDLLDETDAAGRSVVAAMIDTYLAGDAPGMMRLIKQSSGVGGDPELDAKFERLLLTERNARMTERMLERMRAQPSRSFVFAVGTAHYPGDDGILAQLRAAGATVSDQAR